MSSLFLRERSSKFHIYAEYKIDGKKVQERIASYKDKNTAIEELNLLKAKIQLSNSTISKYNENKLINQLNEVKFKSKNSGKFYIYRFVAYEGRVLYVGTTNNLEQRMYQHEHLPKECYQNTTKIEYIEVNSEIDATILEMYFINLYDAKYNTVYKCDKGTELSIEVTNWKSIDNKLLKFWISYYNKLYKL